MKKSFIITLSLLLALTIVGSNNIKPVMAEELENTNTINEESEVTPKTLIDATAKLKGLNDQITTELNKPETNHLIRKNLSSYQNKANAMLAKSPETQVENELNILSSSLETALGDVQYNSSINELESMMTFSLISYDKTSTVNFVSLTQLAKEILNSIDNEINAGIPLSTLTKIPSLLSDLKIAKETLIKNDYTALNNAIEDSKKYNPINYSPSSVHVLNNELVKANKALTIEISATELTTLTKELNDAVASLEALMLPEQKVILDSFVLKVKNFNDSKHSQASKKLIYDMDLKVKDFLNKDIKLLSEAERLLQEITQIETLMANPDLKDPVIVNKTELKTAINKANTKSKSDYTNESWIAFLDKLEIARDVFKNETVLQEMVEMATGNLNEAMDSLTITGNPIKHPFDDMQEFYYVGDIFTLNMGNKDNLKFDLYMFKVEFGKETKFEAIKAGMSEIQFTASNGSIVKYQIEIKEKAIAEVKPETEKPETNKPKHDDETLVQVGISPDHSILVISSMMIITGFFLVSFKRKEMN